MRHPRLWMATGAIVAVILVGGIVAIVLGGGGSSAPRTDFPEYPYSVQTFPDQGNQHVPQGQVVDNYNSNPPTSGRHWSVRGLAPAPWGVSDTPIAKEAAVHNMEHGDVVVWYNCAGGSGQLSDSDCTTLREQLAAIVKPLVDAGQHIVMTAYGGMPHRVALAVWQRLDAFDEFDETRVRAFIDAFRCRYGPEAVQVGCR